MVYQGRIVDKILKNRLEETGAVVIEGPKWCGKTTTAEQFAGSVVYMDDPALSQQYRDMLALQPGALLEGKYPRLFDEWQVAPRLWDAIRHFVDRKNREGLFILTGSAVPVDTNEIIHSGAGRYSWITMSTMSLFESGESTGDVSLNDLFEGTAPGGSNAHELDDIAFMLCRGGWPASIGKSERVALGMVYNYYDAVIRSDVSRVDSSLRSPEMVKDVMRSYARHQGSQSPDTVILNDLIAGNRVQMSINTLKAYISALEKIFVIRDIKAWNPNLRSKTAIRTSPTRYFSDPSIACAALGLGPKDLMNDLETFGLMFETLAIRDLLIYAESLGGNVYHYRDKSGLECDAVVHLRNGCYGLVEMKLGGDIAIEHGAETLKTLASKIDTERMKQPSFMMVLTAVGPFAYKRADGVWVVPVGTLRD